jgi:hypothetical protein
MIRSDHAVWTTGAQPGGHNGGQALVAPNYIHGVRMQVDNRGLAHSVVTRKHTAGAHPAQAADQHKHRLSPGLAGADYCGCLKIDKGFEKQGTESLVDNQHGPHQGSTA